MKLFKDTKIGIVSITDEDGFITALEINPNCDKLSDPHKFSPLQKKAFDELDAYLDGSLKKFTLPLKPVGTDFMKRVWLNLLKIPYGKTVSYKDIAIACGNSRAVRAVGGANNKNPIAIMIPCHRVIGANGKLVGYAGGLELKKKLLDLEATKTSKQNIFCKL